MTGYLRSLRLLPVELVLIFFAAMYLTPADPFGFYVVAALSLTAWLMIRWSVAWYLRR